MQRVVDAAVEKRLRRAAPRALDGSVLGREGQRPLRPVVPGRDAGGAARVRGVHQGPARHAGGRRPALAERRHAPEPRPLRLRASDPLLPRRRQPHGGCEPHRHGGVPREHRGHLRRHRVAGRLRRSAQAHRLPAAAAGGQRHPLPRQLRHRHQAGIEAGQPAPDPQGHPLRHRAGARLGDAGAQGQHHEVHGRRVPQLGLRAGARGVRRQADRRRPVAVICQPRVGAARSSSRT